MAKKHSIIFDKWFLAASLLGTVIMGLLAAYATIPVQIAMLGTAVSIMTGVSLTVMQNVERFSGESKAAMTNLGLVLPLTADRELRSSYEEIVGAFRTVVDSHDAMFQLLAKERIASLSQDFRNLAQQRLVYVGTEGWRTAYAEVLRHSRITEYRSVAWVRNEDYWQDQPGFQSLRVNCELAADRVTVTRIVIHRRTESNADDLRPSNAISAWMKLQYEAGIRLLYVDEQTLMQEKDLLSDFGIYGDVAIGILDADDTSSRTLQFRLSFDPMDVKDHGEKWERLLLYATEWRPSESNTAS